MSIPSNIGWVEGAVAPSKYYTDLLAATLYLVRKRRQCYRSTGSVVDLIVARLRVAECVNVNIPARFSRPLPRYLFSLDGIRHACDNWRIDPPTFYDKVEDMCVLSLRRPMLMSIIERERGWEQTIGRARVVIENIYGSAWNDCD